MDNDNEEKNNNTNKFNKSFISLSCIILFLSDLLFLVLLVPVPVL